MAGISFSCAISVQFSSASATRASLPAPEPTECSEPAAIGGLSEMFAVWAIFVPRVPGNVRSVTTGLGFGELKEWLAVRKVLL